MKTKERKRERNEEEEEKRGEHEKEKPSADSYLKTKKKKKKRKKKEMVNRQSEAFSFFFSSFREAALRVPSFQGTESDSITVQPACEIRVVRQKIRKGSLQKL